MKKITFNVKKVLPRLAQVTSVVLAKNTMPILGCVKLETQKVDNVTLLKLTASDAETWVSTVIDVNGDDGINICLDATDFLKGLQNLGDTDVSLEVYEIKGVVVCNYGSGFFSITCESSKEFPKHAIDDNEFSEFVLPSKSLFEYIKKVSFATNNDDLRPVLNSVHFDLLDDKMVVVSTDGQRLAKVEDKSIKDTQGEIKSLSLPTRPSSILCNILSLVEDDVKCKFNHNVVVFSNQHFKLSTRLIEGRYPNYESVIPKNDLQTVTINKDNFTSAIKRVSPMGNSMSELITLTFSGNNIVIKTENIELSKKAEETISCEYDGIDMTIGFKYSYLLQALQSMQTEKVTMDVISPERACIIKPVMGGDAQYLCLLMPLKID